jgi:hypothetical protein
LSLFAIIVFISKSILPPSSDDSFVFIQSAVLILSVSYGSPWGHLRLDPFWGAQVFGRRRFRAVHGGACPSLWTPRRWLRRAIQGEAKREGRQLQEGCRGRGGEHGHRGGSSVTPSRRPSSSWQYLAA